MIKSLFKKNKKKLFIILFILSCFSFLSIGNVEAVCSGWSQGWRDTSGSKCRRFRTCLNYNIAETGSQYIVDVTSWGIELQENKNSGVSKKNNCGNYTTGWGSYDGVWKNNYYGSFSSSDNSIPAQSYSQKKQFGMSFHSFGNPAKVTYTKGYSASGVRTVSARTKTVSSMVSLNYLTTSFSFTVPQRSYYYIYYNLNGGTGNFPTQTKWADDPLTVYSFVPNRTGYNFRHWLSNAGVVIPAGGQISWGSNASYTLTAQWTPVNYKITYHLDGGTASNPTLFNIESNAFTINNPTKTGYTFTGWTGTGLTGETINVTIPKGSTGNREYTANYDVHSYKVKFDRNSELNTEGSLSDINTKYDTYIKLPTSGIKKKNHVISAWCTKRNPNDGGVCYTPGQDVKNLTAVNNGEVTLYAQWAENSIVTMEKITSTSSTGEILNTEEMTLENGGKDSAGNYIVKNSKEKFEIRYESDSNGKVFNTKEIIESGNSPTGRETVPKEENYILDGWVCTNTNVRIKESDGTIREVQKNDKTNKMSSNDIKKIIVNKQIAKELSGGESKGIILKAFHKKKTAPKNCVVYYESDSNGLVLFKTKEEKKENESPSGAMVIPKFITYSFKGWTCNKDVLVKEGSVAKTIAKGEYLSKDQVKNIILRDSIRLKARFAK